MSCFFASTINMTGARRTGAADEIESRKSHSPDSPLRDIHVKPVTGKDVDATIGQLAHREEYRRNDEFVPRLFAYDSQSTCSLDLIGQPVRNRMRDE